MTPTFQGEMQLAGWSESHTSGAKLTFWLPEAADLEVFRGMTSRKGHKAGQRFAVVLVEIGDDEKPVQQPAEKPKGKELAQLAGRWCADPYFQHWLGATDEDDAAAQIRLACRITSRAELDHNEQAAAKFHRTFREPFRQYCKEQGIEL